MIFYKYKKIDKRLKKRLILVVTAIFVFFIINWFWGIFSEPDAYEPIKPIDGNAVSLYLSNKLIPDLHNKSQYGRPFDYVISQQGVNDIIARHADFKKIRSAGFESVAVKFVPEKILVIGKVKRFGMDLFVSIALKPTIDKNGRFAVKSQKVNVGSSKIPFAAAAMRKKLLNSIESFIDDQKVSQTIADVISKKTVEPTLKFNGNRIRAEKLDISLGEIKIHFVPVDYTL